jgi:hypothetical protein
VGFLANCWAVGLLQCGRVQPAHGVRDCVVRGDAVGEVLLLLFDHLPRPWQDVCQKRLQSVQVLSLQVPSSLSEEAQSEEAEMDQGL